MPAPYAISTVTAAELITVQKMNEQWQDNISLLLNPPACRVYNNAGLTHTSTGNWQALSGFNSERYDTASMHSTSVNTGRITVPIAGLYLITGNVEFAANGTGIRGIKVRANGTTDLGAIFFPNNGGSLGTGVALATVYKLAANDYIELHAFQNSGGNLGLSSAASYSPEFSATWMGIG